MPAGSLHTATAAAYYEDADVSTFYETCWGGSDIHIGLYAGGDMTIAEASAAMTRHLLALAGIRAGQQVLDIACGFGGTLRMLARMGCHAAGIDISRACVEIARKANADADLASAIDVSIGDFHAIESANEAWDAVICQESIIHSNNRARVFAEAYRVLRPGGAFALSDIMTGEGADIDMVKAAFSRLNAAAGATLRDYQEMARAAGFEVMHVEERPEDIKTHYDKLAEALEEPVAGLDAQAARAIQASIERMQSALAGGHVTWGCLVARKPL